MIRAFALVTLLLSATAFAEKDSSSCPKGGICLANRFRATASAGTNAITLNTDARIFFGSSYYIRSDGAGTLWFNNLFPRAPGYGANVASGNNAFFVLNNGARVDFGSGASDYASSDGTTVTFAGPIAADGATVTKSVAAGGGAISFGFAGGYLQWGVGTLPTCAAGLEGRSVRDNTSGGSSSLVRTKLCLCTSDGAASPSYAWVNLSSGVVGTSTTCPATVPIQMSSASASHDLASIANGACSTTTFGAVMPSTMFATDTCTVNVSPIFGVNNVVMTARAVSNSTVNIFVCNFSGAAYDPPSSTYYVNCFH